MIYSILSFPYFEPKFFLWLQHSTFLLSFLNRDLFGLKFILITLNINFKCSTISYPLIYLDFSLFPGGTLKMFILFSFYMPQFFCCIILFTSSFPSIISLYLPETPIIHKLCHSLSLVSSLSSSCTVKFLYFCSMKFYMH